MHLSLSVPVVTGNQIKQAAAQEGQSLNAWILDAIRDKL
jgi:predicted HicB family RNase H-like nuclease